MKRPGFKSQLNTLIERNIAILLASYGSLSILLFLPIIIGFCLGQAWKDNSSESTTYFVMAISAIFMGCMNSCCEIVKERPILQRERMFQLSIWAYLYSKASILIVICSIQIILMLALQSHYMNIKGNIFLHFIFISLTSICSTGLGLLISCCSKKALTAVIWVPIIIMPQIIFSKVVLGQHIDQNKMIEKFTLSKWSYQAMEIISKTAEGLKSEQWQDLFMCLIFFLSSFLIFLFLSACKLKYDEI